MLLRNLLLALGLFCWLGVAAHGHGAKPVPAQGAGQTQPPAQQPPASTTPSAGNIDQIIASISDLIDKLHPDASDEIKQFLTYLILLLMMLSSPAG